jgi:hypothetical protein
MTRDEAVAAYIRFTYEDLPRTAAQMRVLHVNAARRIDAYVALGMLKLDEPKSAEDRAIDILASIDSKVGLTRFGAATAIIDLLYSAGLKIVEK